MGRFVHKAICVTSTDDTAMNILHEKARELFGKLVTPVIDSKINGFKSFFVAPSGSKVGWEEDSKHEESCEAFMEASKHTRADAVYLHYGELDGDDDARIEDTSNRFGEDR